MFKVQKKKKTRTCALEHHFKVTKSSLLDCFGHLWQLVRWPLYGWYSGLTRWVLGTGSSLTPMYVRMFIWHHLGGQFSQNHKMKKKALQKSYSHFAIQSEDMIFKEMWHAIVISPAKMPPPLSKCRGSLEFFHGLLLQLPTYDNSNPPPVTLREPRQLGRLHWLLESGLPHVSNGGGKKRTGKPIRLYAGWKP